MLTVVAIYQIFTQPTVHNTADIHSKHNNRINEKHSCLMNWTIIIYFIQIYVIQILLNAIKEDQVN